MIPPPTGTLLLFLIGRLPSSALSGQPRLSLVLAAVKFCCVGEEPQLIETLLLNPLQAHLEEECAHTNKHMVGNAVDR